MTESRAMPALRYPRLNPLRRRVWFDGEGWCAEYQSRDGRSSWTSTGFESRDEALEGLRRFVGMKVQEIDGTFVEVPRKPRWWWPR